MKVAEITYAVTIAFLLKYICVVCIHSIDEHMPAQYTPNIVKPMDYTWSLRLGNASSTRTAQFSFVFLSILKVSQD